MKIQRLVMFVFLIAFGLFPQVGCRKVEVFSIIGLWEIDQTLYFPDEPFLNYQAAYLFSGNETEGTVSRYPFAQGTLRGVYTVTGDKVTFGFYQFHGMYSSVTRYTGHIYRELDKIMGTVESKHYYFGNLESSYGGPFVATR